MIEVVEKFKGGAKQLPRDPNTGKILNVFEAGGKKFYILTGDDAFPISRWTQWGQFNYMFMAAADFTNAYGKRRDMDVMLNDMAMQRNNIRISDVIVANQAEMKEIQKMSEARFDALLYIATLFIVGENEDITKWAFPQSDEKIKIWADEGYGEADFLALAAHYAAAYMEKRTAYLNTIAGGVAVNTPSGTASTG